MSRELVRETDAPVSDCTQPGLARWAVVIDAVVVLLVVLAASVALFGGIRTRILGVRLSVTSPGRLLVEAGVLFLIRHGFVRRDPLFLRIWRGLRRLRSHTPPGLATSLKVGLTSRLAVLLVGYFAVVMVGFGIPPDFRVSDNELANLAARWDAGWYLSIAREGYTWNPNADRQQSIAFFPAYPVLMWLVGLLAGARPQVGPESTIVNAGLVVSLAAFMWALVYLYRLAREDLTDDQATAAITLLAAYPFAVFYSAPYTEALFLLTAAAAVYRFRQRAFLASGVWGLVAGLTRPNGCLLSIPLGVMALGELWPTLRSVLGAVPAASAPREEQGGRRTRAVRALAAAAAPGIGMLLYSAYVFGLTGRPFMWAEVHGAWGREYQSLDEMLLDRYEYMLKGGLSNYLTVLPSDTLNLVAAVAALAMVWFVFRRFGLAYATFVAANVVVPLAAGGPISMGRLTSVLFPIFFALAAYLPAQTRLVWTLAFGIGQGLIAVLFFTWRPMF